MKKMLLAALCSAAILPALAQEAKVDITLNAAMPSIRDPSRNDAFKFTLTDAKIVTSLALECQAGRTQALAVSYTHLTLPTSDLV